MSDDYKELEKKLSGVGTVPPPPVLPQRPTKRQQLEQKRRMFQEALARVESAIKALDKNPEFEKFLNVLGDAE